MDRCGYAAAHGTTGPDGVKLHDRPGQVLRVVANCVMCGSVMMVVVVMPRGCERRTGKQHQEESGGEKLFHETNVARLATVEKTTAHPAPN
jgi:hypothetical protein